MLPDGTPGWILISQIDHARLAAEWAENWGSDAIAPIEPHADVLAATLHHDDGWQARDEDPLFDPTSGRVLDFMEMPLAESLAIWRASIEAAAQFGPLPAYTVSGHFCALLERSMSHHQDEPRRCALGQEFLDRQRSKQDAWLATWQAGDPGRRTTEVADHALGLLQMFDWISLWFCCARRDKPETIDTPDGPSVTISPRSPTDLTIHPWPLSVDELTLSVTGQAVPAGHYANTQQLARHSQGSVTLTWTVRPG